MNLNDALSYRVGLSKIEEMVISSHFMHKISQNRSLNLYDEQHFLSSSVIVTHKFVENDLIPILKRACASFCEKRAAAAKRRSIERYESFGHASPEHVGLSEAVTEILLDKEFSRSGEKYNSRRDLNSRIRKMLDEKGMIEMVIPALPFKIPSPLKSRGHMPDLGEINFLLSAYEIARTVEIVCENESVNGPGIRAKFTVVCDGSRFDGIVNESSETLRAYREKLANWIPLLGIEEYVELVDYRELLQKRLPKEVWSAKLDLFRQACASYAKSLWPVFDPDNMFASFEAATQVELDPEYGNAEGRFVSLFKSLVYTVRYKALQELSHLSSDQRARIYRELTAHIFQPYTVATDSRCPSMPVDTDDEAGLALPLESRERLRRAMLTEAWEAAICYVSEIKSDRDLAEDPILTCLPGHLRWTIHPKQGQLAIATPPILGISVQPWAGSGVFRPMSKGGIRLCTLPSLILEGSRSIPVVLEDNLAPGTQCQPLFYLDEELGIGSMAELRTALNSSYTRQRFS